jgi:hypothetical protein
LKAEKDTWHNHWRRRYMIDEKSQHRSPYGDLKPVPTEQDFCISIAALILGSPLKFWKMSVVSG